MVIKYAWRQFVYQLSSLELHGRKKFSTIYVLLLCQKFGFTWFHRFNHLCSL